MSSFKELLAIGAANKRAKGNELVEGSRERTRLYATSDPLREDGSKCKPIMTLNLQKRPSSKLKSFRTRSFDVWGDVCTYREVGTHQVLGSISLVGANIFGAKRSLRASLSSSQEAPSGDECDLKTQFFFSGDPAKPGKSAKPRTLRLIGQQKDLQTLKEFIACINKIVRAYGDLRASSVKGIQSGVDQLVMELQRINLDNFNLPILEEAMMFCRLMQAEANADLARRNVVIEGDARASHARQARGVDRRVSFAADPHLYSASKRERRGAQQRERLPTTVEMRRSGTTLQK